MPAGTAAGISARTGRAGGMRAAFYRAPPGNQAGKRLDRVFSLASAVRACYSRVASRAKRRDTKGTE